jgi:hypothetical protein
VLGYLCSQSIVGDGAPVGGRTRVRRYSSITVAGSWPLKPRLFKKACISCHLNWKCSHSVSFGVRVFNSDKAFNNAKKTGSIHPSPHGSGYGLLHSHVISSGPPPLILTPSHLHIANCEISLLPITHGTVRAFHSLLHYRARTRHCLQSTH